ncbi:hypothetical protein E4U59_002542, partial [Claviceps monticola]
ILFKITRHALLKTSEQLKYARAELEKQRLDSSYQFSPCEGRYTRSKGLPCWHRLAELWRTSGILQVSDYHVHWWVDRNQNAEDVERPNVPLEPRPLETRRRQQHSRHQRGAGPRGTRRDPSLFERLDANNRAASPPSSLPSRMITQRAAVVPPGVPPGRVFMFQATPPATATPNTATTALSRPYSAHQRPLHAPQTPIPAATLQQLPNHMQQPQLTFVQPQQGQLPAFPPPQLLQQVPLQSLQSCHEPQHPPSSSHGQASMPGWSQPQLQPHRFRLLAPAPSYEEPQSQPPTMPVGVDESFRFPIPARQSGWSAHSMLYDSRN